MFYKARCEESSRKKCCKAFPEVAPGKTFLKMRWDLKLAWMAG
jgi:hypothetical protein